MSTKSGRMAQELAVSLKGVSIEDRDRGAVQLARRLAQLLDAARGTASEPKVFDDLAPKYLAVLTALGLTPAGRGKGGDRDGQQRGTKLDELRERRQRRIREG